MKRRGTIMRALSGAGVIVLVGLIATGSGLANHTNLGLLFVSSTEFGNLFSIHLPNVPLVSTNQVLRASGLTSAEGIACGPDGKVYVTQTGLSIFEGPPGPRRIVRFSQPGTTGPELVLDFATTPGLPTALVNSGGPEGPSFGLVKQDDGRLVPSGELFFNTRAAPNPNNGTFEHTGVWKLPAVGVTPVQVIPPFGEADVNGEATAFLTTAPFAGHLLAVDFPGGRVVRRAPPFTSAVAGENFIIGLAGPNGLAINSAGEVFVAESNPTDGTRKIRKFASNGGSLGIFAMITQTPRKIGFDAADNLYVATVGGPVLRFPQPSEEQTTVGNVPGGNGVTVCPRRIRAFIDIKPGSFPNPINVKSNGVIPVAILGTAFFNPVTEVNQANLKFGPKELLDADPNNGASPARPCKAEDVNADGRLDLLCHFKQKDTGFAVGDTTGVVRWGNQDFEGEAGIVTGTD